MTTVGNVADYLGLFAPLPLAESWDNVGLLLGNATAEVNKILTCLTVTPPVVAEAIERQVSLIVTHHPMLFRPVQRLTSETTQGRMVLDLLAHGMAVYSPHTAFDSAPLGINQRLAQGLELQKIEPLVAYDGPPLPLGDTTDNTAPAFGSGRAGSYPQPRNVVDVIERAKQLLGIEGLHLVGDPQRKIKKLAVACGSAGEFLVPARAAGCDCLLTGETQFHTCLEAEATDIGLILVGHYASERFAVEQLADVLASEFEQLDSWPSRAEQDPLRWL